jgi:glycosyltransferase involved in cell wall biosynthesis
MTVLLHGDPRAPQQARLGAALAARGHRVIVADAPAVAATIRGEHGQACETVSLPSFGPGILRRFWAKRRAHALGVDVVHLNFIRPWHDIWSKMQGGPPYVATAWGTDINEEVFKKPRRVTARVDHVLAHAAALTADSVPLLAKAKAKARAGGAAEIPSDLVLWGVDLQSFDRARVLDGSARWRRALGVEPGQRVLLSPRQTKPHYHVDRILRAFAASRWAKGDVFVIKLHGRPEEAPYVAELKALAASLGVAERVRFADPCPYPELPALYAAADAAVSLLEMDGVPSTFCELMALEVPIVASDLPAYEGVLEDGDRALLVPPQDHGALARALDRLIEEPDLGPRLASRGRAWALSRADWQRCVDQFEALYRSAITMKARPR